MTQKAFTTIADVAKCLDLRVESRKRYYCDRTWLDDEDERLAAALNRVLRESAEGPK